MENASKALIMAAGVLIAVIVLSLFAYLYFTFNQATKDNIKQMEQSKITSFNSKYLAYDGREDLTYYDIANIATMAKNDNEDSDEKIRVVVGNSDNDLTNDYNSLMDKFENQNSINEIMTDGTENDPATGQEMSVKFLTKYKCKVSLDNTGRVSEVRFYKIS